MSGSTSFHVMNVCPARWNALTPLAAGSTSFGVPSYATSRQVFAAFSSGHVLMKKAPLALPLTLTHACTTAVASKLRYAGPRSDSGLPAAFASPPSLNAVFSG